MATFRVQLCLGQLRPWDSAPAAVEWGQGNIRRGFRVGPEASMQCAAGELRCRPSSWSVFRAQCHECKACPWLFGWGTLRKRCPAPQRGLGSLRPQARGSLSPCLSVWWSFCQSQAGQRDVFTLRWEGSESESGVFSQASGINMFAMAALTLAPRLCLDQCQGVPLPTDCHPGMLPKGLEQGAEGTRRQAQAWQLVFCPE